MELKKTKRKTSIRKTGSNRVREKQFPCLHLCDPTPRRFVLLKAHFAILHLVIQVTLKKMAYDLYKLHQHITVYSKWWPSWWGMALWL